MNKIQMRQSLLLLLTATIWGVAFVAHFQLCQILAGGNCADSLYLVFGQA